MSRTQAAPGEPSRDLDRLRRAHLAVAKLTADDPVYLPIFNRLEAELAVAEAATSPDPLTRARALARQSATR